MEKLRILLFVFLPLVLAACKHPLAIQGQGDIVERLNGLRGCSLEEFAAGNFSTCTDNDVFVDETVLYQGLPRPGWRFSHWEGPCRKDSVEPLCELNYTENGARYWDENHPDNPLPATTAVFVEDKQAPAAVEYIAANHGATGAGTYSALLEALFSSEGSYRYLNLQGSTRNYFDRTPYYYQRQSDSLLITSPAARISPPVAQPPVRWISSPWWIPMPATTTSRCLT